jgi:hypothetical protein
VTRLQAQDAALLQRRNGVKAQPRRGDVGYHASSVVWLEVDIGKFTNGGSRSFPSFHFAGPSSQYASLDFPESMLRAMASSGSPPYGHKRGEDEMRIYVYIFAGSDSTWEVERRSYLANRRLYQSRPSWPTVGSAQSESCSSRRSPH